MSMARYSAFLGRRVEVHYRAGDILLPASGTFVADSGRSIFLEQHLMQHGQQKNFRWEIPYQYIVRMEEVKELPYPPSDRGGNTPAPTSARRRAKETAKVSGAKQSQSSSSAAAGAAAAVDGSPILPLGQPPKPV
jgi:hypothetical protein